ncbi:hypothetical protein AVEN_94247-1 [Araneus ventricosus]|uniref:Uncharacterized protein n=1 Tax=Araneus ventricosus TaxID=182803 RepID=A0A4Y2II51_ARAVE|nr:hypothetical protein AVEN_94247-1 [Araneus ventricosus]
MKMLHRAVHVKRQAHREATRGLFWDRPRYFELWSDDKDDICFGPSPQTFKNNINVQQEAYTTYLRWNSVPSLGPCGPKPRP